MARFLHALQGDGLAHQGVRHHRRERGDDRAGAAFGVVHLLPERHRAQTGKLGGIKIRPRQGGGIVELVGLEELAAEQFLVRVGPDFDLHAAASMGL